ncbi:ferredoxin reductase family protein [Microbacterium karelineae]|uniref:ferredoxin reductase family protein n=1 Tax=Microbacterium karelineae TaxID=2654283 RepID=UPI0012EACE5E|nr:ferredoxin reductase family protein [Microbacterium karelineae]
MSEEAARRSVHGVTAERSVLAVIGIGAALVIMQTILGAPWPQDIVPFVAHLSGMLAGYGAAVMILLVSRLPFLERRVGADRLTRWHAHGGRTLLLLVCVHAVFAVYAVAEAIGASGAEAVGIVLGLPDIVTATVGTVLMMAAGMLSARAARKRVRYETWHGIHLAMYVGVGLGFAHQLAGPDIAGRPALQIAWTALYTVTFALLMRYRILAPLLTALQHDLRVHRVLKQGPRVTTIIVTGRDLDELGADPGQFFRWRFLTQETWASAHPFSLSAPPSRHFLRLTVKEVGNGTRRLAGLTEGTRVLAEGPYGAMTAARRRGHGVLLVAGGIGITPMRALLETIPVEAAPLTLVYRASSPEDVVFREELDAIASARGAEVHYLVGSSRERPNELTLERLRELVPGLDTRDVFICASPRLGRAIRALLREAGVPQEQVHQEEFAF